jgi:uncharacterized OB-fold protein
MTRSTAANSAPPAPEAPAAASDGLPLVPFIKVDGEARVEALRCSFCDAAMTSEPLACPACGARGTLSSFRVAATGKLHAYSIVHRSYPGVETPFISAIVDMDDGVTLKGVLRGVAPVPEAIAPGMAVRLAFDDALGRRDREGRAYVSYFFSPAELRPSAQEAQP